jgi:hypothetical protein
MNWDRFWKEGPQTPFLECLKGYSLGAMNWDEFWFYSGGCLVAIAAVFFSWLGAV